MMKLITENWVILLVMLIMLLLIYVSLQTRFKGHIAGFLLELVREAENTYGSGTGAVKKAYVCEVIYNMLPSLAKLLIPQKIINKLIDAAADELTYYLESLTTEEKEKLI